MLTTTFSDLAKEASEIVVADAVNAGLSDNGISLGEGGHGAAAYADAVRVYLSIVVDKCCDYWSTICTWHSSKQLIRNTFGRQSIPMTWDYAETNPLCDSTGNWIAMTDWASKALARTATSCNGTAAQLDAQNQSMTLGNIVSTDPPYYDNISYADLSDFFYSWLRPSLKSVFPELFATLAVPKAEELVANPYRQGGKRNAETFFLDGMTLAMKRIADQSHPSFPVTIYYAFKQSETKSATGTASTGWETFLAAVLKAGFALHGTWPIRTELANRMIGAGNNALASSVVLVCQRRQESASVLSRNDFRRKLRQKLPQALKELERANIAPVDVAQAAIGPGMAIFSSAKAVLRNP